MKLISAFRKRHTDIADSESVKNALSNDGYRVLVVEDDPGDQALLARALGHDSGCVDVLFAKSESEFAELVNTGHLDCVLFDFNLTDGCRAPDLLPRLRKAQPDCPAIVISGSDDQCIVVASMRSGSVDFIHKDDAIDQQKLWARIGVAIRASREKVESRTAERRKTLKVIREAETDVLTGLGNRRVVDRLLRRLAECPPESSHNMTFAMIDIDHFKRINDTHGHTCGDCVIQSVSAVLREHTPDRATIVRWGGEEFLVIIPDADVAAGIEFAEAMRRAVKNEVVACRSSRVAITVSIGLCSQPARQVSSKTIEYADAALFEAKRFGRDCIRSSGDSKNSAPDGPSVAALDRSINSAG